MRAYDREYRDFDIGHKVCDCGRWWTTLREAIMDGYSCVNGKRTCDYCYMIEQESEDTDIEEMEKT